MSEKLKARALEWLRNEAKYGTEARYAAVVLELLTNASPQDRSRATLSSAASLATRPTVLSPAGDASSALSSARLATEAVPVADIEAEIAHIEENGQRVKELPGMTDEGRCRELCAMYLREFISNLRANKRLAELSARPAAPSSEGVTCPECATARAAANSWKDELMRLKSAQPAGAVALEAQEVVERWNHAVEECALAAEHVTPRHTECGNKIARAIRALKGLPSAPSATGEKKP